MSTEANTDPRHQTSQEAAPAPARDRQAAIDDESNEDQELVVMAIDRQQKGAISCAYYVAREERLCCLQDVTNGSMDAVATCEFVGGRQRSHLG